MTLKEQYMAYSLEKMRRMEHYLDFKQWCEKQPSNNRMEKAE